MVRDGFHLAATEEEKEAVYRFRYDVYVEEMGRYGETADHENRRLVEPEDETARIWYAAEDGQVVATQRISWGGDAPFSERLIEHYQMAPFLKELPRSPIGIGVGRRVWRSRTWEASVSSSQQSRQSQRSRIWHCRSGRTQASYGRTREPFASQRDALLQTARSSFTVCCLLRSAIRDRYRAEVERKAARRLTSAVPLGGGVHLDVIPGTRRGHTPVLSLLFELGSLVQTEFGEGPALGVASLRERPFDAFLVFFFCVFATSSLVYEQFVVFGIDLSTTTDIFGRSWYWYAPSFDPVS